MFKNQIYINPFTLSDNIQIIESRLHLQLDSNIDKPLPEQCYTAPLPKG